MEKILKTFKCITGTEKNETQYFFKAIMKKKSFSKYRIIIHSIHFESGQIRIINDTQLFFYTKKGMNEAYEYHYNLLKNNIFTKTINKE